MRGQATWRELRTLFFRFSPCIEEQLQSTKEGNSARQTSHVQHWRDKTAETLIAYGNYHLHTTTETFVVLVSKPYDSLIAGEFLSRTLSIGDSLFILHSIWASSSPRHAYQPQQFLTMTPKQNTQIQCGTEQTMQRVSSVSRIGSEDLMRRQSLQRGSM